MTQLIILSFLLVLVYQFDEVVRMVYAIIWKIRHKKFRALVRDTDHYVGMVLALATMPLALNYLVISDKPLAHNLAVLAGLFLLFATLTTILSVFGKKLSHAQHYQNVSALVSVSYTFASLMHPVWRAVPWHGERGRVELGKLAFLLSLPPLAALAFKYYYTEKYFETEFVKYMDVLIIVLVGGLFMNITAHALRRYLKVRNLSLMSYFRIVLGIAIALFLLK